MLGLTTLLLAAGMILILIMRPEGIMGKREFSLNRLRAAIFKKTHQELV
jgi:ABC-type branched-subunit amino acid transport system permease subunit